MSGRRPLTEIAQEAWKDFLRPGAWAVDATAGNGLDTEFLARSVGPEGRVLAIDIQDSALLATRQRLQGSGLLDRVTLIRGDHARVREMVACDARGRISLACFNLGYLPHGDHGLTTRRETTILALMAALLLMSPDGALSVIAYRGHAGALEEAEAVERFFNSLPSPWTCRQKMETGRPDHPGPVWWLATGRKP